MASIRTMLMVVVCSLLGESAIASEDGLFEQHPDVPPGVAASPVLELYVTLTDKVVLGQTDAGERNIVPITGGYFRGTNPAGVSIKGKIMPGGADWQLVRVDGVQEYVARYSIRTDDGQTIMVDNRGISRPDGDGRYRVTAPKFHAPSGKYQWLNEYLFAGTITSIKKPRAVIIRAYPIK